MLPINNTKNSIWISISVASQLAGVNAKTIRRAIQSDAMKYKIIKNRYLIDLQELIFYSLNKTKLKNKFNEFGMGQYVEKWKEQHTTHNIKH